MDPFHPVREIVVDRLAGLLRHLEANGPSCFALTNRCTIGRVTMWRHVNQLQADDVTPTKLAVYAQVKQREVPKATRQLKARSYRPDCFGRRGGLAPASLPLFRVDFGNRDCCD